MVESKIVENKVKEIKRLEINWSKRQLVKYFNDNELIIQTTGEYTDKNFSGVVIVKSDNNREVGYFSSNWNKLYFYPLQENVTIEFKNEQSVYNIIENTNKRIYPKEIYQKELKRYIELIQSRKRNCNFQETFDLQSEFNKEFRRLLSSYKTVRFLDSNGEVSTIPTQRVELLDENGEWLFDYSLEKGNEHFWFSYCRIAPILESKFSIDYPQVQQLMLPVLEEDFKLKGVTPKRMYCNK